MGKNFFGLLVLLLISGAVLLIISKPAALVVNTASQKVTQTQEALTTKEPVEPVVKKVGTSSLSIKVGTFTVTEMCSTLDKTDLMSVRTIYIEENGEPIQTIPIANNQITPGSKVCPPIYSQDINFDKIPDFMIDSNYGSGGTVVTYWLFNTRTGQFYCPEGSYLYCTLMNPTFDSDSKTIVSRGALGAGHGHIETFHVENGILVLTKREEY